MKEMAVSKRTLTRVALLTGPVLIAALALNSSFSNAAVETPATTTKFERVQFADVIEAAQPAVVQITVTKSLGEFNRSAPPSTSREVFSGGSSSASSW